MDMAPLKYNSLFKGASNGTHKSNYKCRRRLRTEEGHLNTALATTTACRLKEVVWYYGIVNYNPTVSSHHYCSYKLSMSVMSLPSSDEQSAESPREV